MLYATSKGNDFENAVQGLIPSLQTYKTYYSSNRNTLPFKILELLFVKQNAFTHLIFLGNDDFEKM